MDGISSWAVFLDNHTMMQQVVDYYNGGVGNGRITNYISPSGQCQESGRDQGHSMMGEEHLLATALTVWHATNSSNLFSAHDFRLRTGRECAAQYNLGHDVPFQPNCDVPSPGNAYVIQVPQFAHDYGSMSDTFIPRSRYGT